MENRAWYLFSKKLTGEASSSERMELNNMLSTYPHLHEKLQALEAVWQSSKKTAYPSNFDQDFNQLVGKMKSAGVTFEAGDTAAQSIDEMAVPNRRPFRKMALAGLLAIAAAAVYLVAYFVSQASGPVQGPAGLATNNQVLTRSGSRSKIVLPDGTQVWLNADSKLTYANDFGRTSRDVSLSGEAYFDVVPNKNVPFYIHTSKINIKVTGTSFNVRAYPNETKSETSLLHGKVEVTLLAQPNTTYYLKPSEKLIVTDEWINQLAKEGSLAMEHNGKKKLRVSDTPIIEKLVYDAVEKIPVETAWVNNKLAFNDESFREVANKMERWFGVSIEFSNSKLEEIRFTGRFEQETIKEALEAMQLTARFQFSISNQHISITNPTK